MNRESKRYQAREERRQERAAAEAAPATTATTSEPRERRRSTPPQFLGEVRSELKRVAWPSRNEVINYTVVVLAVTTVLTLAVWAFDWVISNAIINLFE